MLSRREQGRLVRADSFHVCRDVLIDDRLHQLAHDAGQRDGAIVGRVQLAALLVDGRHIRVLPGHRHVASGDRATKDEGDGDSECQRACFENARMQSVRADRNRIITFK